MIDARDSLLKGIRVPSTTCARWDDGSIVARAELGMLKTFMARMVVLVSVMPKRRKDSAICEG